MGRPPEKRKKLVREDTTGIWNTETENLGIDGFWDERNGICCRKLSKKIKVNMSVIKSEVILNYVIKFI